MIARAVAAGIWWSVSLDTAIIASFTSPDAGTGCDDYWLVVPKTRD